MKRLYFHLIDGTVISTTDESEIKLYYAFANSEYFFNRPIIDLKDNNGNICTINARHIIYTHEEDI